MSTLPLLDNKKTKPYIVLRFIWNLGILLAIVGIILWDSYPIVSRRFLLTFLISFVIWIIGNLIIKKYLIIGTIEIGIDLITINDKEVIYFNINKTENLQIKYGGTKGDSYGAYGGLFRVNDGSNNSISFEYDGKSFKYCFLVTKKYFLNSLYNIFKAWEVKGVRFRIFSNKVDVTEKVLNRIRIN